MRLLATRHNLRTRKIPHWLWRRIVIVTLLLGPIACLTCGLASYAILLTTATPGSAQIDVEVCVGAVNTRSLFAQPLQVGLWWHSASLSTLFPVTASPMAVCTTLPWPSTGSPTGEITVSL